LKIKIHYQNESRITNKGVEEIKKIEYMDHT